MVSFETFGLGYIGPITLDGEDTYWNESRSAEGGRYVIMRRSSEGKIIDVTPSTFNARTTVHEYGGAPFIVSNGTVYFSNFADQRLYRQDSGSKPRPITPEGDLRYANGVIDYHRKRIICVREDHTGKGEAVNTLVSLDLNVSDEAKILTSGNDFYSSPALSPDGSHLAWLTWNRPSMPWTGTELWIGDVKKDGSIGHMMRIASGVNESIFQPEYLPDGTLYFVSDRNGWWNLYRWHNRRVEPLHEMEAEFGVPSWIFGMRTYAFESANRIFCTYTQRGSWYLASLNPANGKLETIETPYTSFEFLQASPGRVVFLASSPTEGASIVQFNPATHTLNTLYRSGDIKIDPEYITVAEAIEFPTEQGLTAHAFYYKPKNPDYVAPSNERPPLLVMSHGGPTAAVGNTLNMMIQYWTSRGIAVVDVNYGGSTGYGREYLKRLDGQWGIVDVGDCVNSAHYLVRRGEVDPDRLAIRGGSAGGYTTLCALAFRDIFKCGASYYGIADLEAWAQDTHKFESRYLDSIIGSYPEQRKRYRERSAINYIDQFSCPVIFFQGLDDKIVPANQAETMFAALRKKGLPVAYIPFEGEQHGFHHAENIKRSLDAELYFYAKIFGFELAEPAEPVKIENL